MAFHYPFAFWFLLTIPLLLLLGALFGIKIRNDRRRFASAELYDNLTRSLSRTKKKIGYFAFMIGLFFLIIACTEPRFGTKTEIIRRTGTDVVIALDTSYSMLAEDIKPNRIKQARYEIHHLINNLEGDRVALVAFAGKTFVQCPLTSDYAAAKTLLEYIDVGIISEPGSDIGGAIEGSLELLKKGSEAGSESQIIILFTDGEDLEGNIQNGLKQSEERGVRIFTVGIGTTGGELIPIRDDNGQVEGYKKDRNGNVVKTSLDDKTLMDIASKTNGSYLRSENGEVDVEIIIDQLGRMQKSDIHERKISRLKERYQIPLGISLMFLLTWLIVGERRKDMEISRQRIKI
ncbi:MAG: VWA domain-containing protein [Candidatus Latescibacteria bacterium]|nr:VWA domain-containing protein [Candidatus Latescibacterota bacterium]